MNWNRVLFTMTIWMVHLIRLTGVLAFMVLTYLLLFKGFIPEVALALDSDYDFLRKTETLVFDNIPEELVSDLNIRSKGYLVDVSLEGKDKALYITSFMIFIIAYYLLATVLLRLVTSAKEGEFFIRKNVMRLRLIGFALIVVEPLSWLYKYLSKMYLSKILNLDLFYSITSVRLDSGLINSPVLLGLLVLIIAQAFNHGLYIQKDQELTI